MKLPTGRSYQAAPSHCSSLLLSVSLLMAIKATISTAPPPEETTGAVVAQQSSSSDPVFCSPRQPGPMPLPAPISLLPPSCGESCRVVHGGCVHEKKREKMLQFVYYLSPRRPQPPSGPGRSLARWLSPRATLETRNSLGWREKLLSWVKSRRDQSGLLIY